MISIIIFRPISNSRQDDSPNRPSLDERLDIELGINETTEDTQNIIDEPKLSKYGSPFICLCKSVLLEAFELIYNSFRENPGSHENITANIRDK